MGQNFILQRYLPGIEYRAMYETSLFYRKAAIIFACLTVVTLAIGHFCIEQTLLVERLLPSQKSTLPWRVETTSDADTGGSSTVHVNDASQNLDYTFNASDRVEYSYASVTMTFRPKGKPRQFADLSRFTHIRFSTQCAPKNVLSLTVYSFDTAFSKLDDPSTYRIPVTFFACEESWKQVEVDLRHMEIPEWWLNLHHLRLSDRNYDLSQVASFSFGLSTQSPRNVDSAVKIVELELVGRDWRYAYFFAFFAAALWLGYGLWFFKKHSRVLVADLQEKMQKDRPLIAYQQLSVEPHRDKEKSAVLRYMATEYANPDISLDSAITAIGINRAKMNSILKDEIGLTFSAYLNKLRLTEAARLLAEKPEANVAEIAFSVGYNNVSYFNKLFKNEYGCSPKTFKSVYPQKGLTDSSDESARPPSSN